MSYEIGTKFYGQGKRKDIYTVIDIVKIFSVKENKFIDTKYIIKNDDTNILGTKEITETTLTRAKFDGRIINK